MRHFIQRVRRYGRFNCDRRRLGTGQGNHQPCAGDPDHNCDFLLTVPYVPEMHRIPFADDHPIQIRRRRQRKAAKPIK